MSIMNLGFLSLLFCSCAFKYSFSPNKPLSRPFLVRGLYVLLLIVCNGIDFFLQITSSLQNCPSIEQFLVICTRKGPKVTSTGP